MEISNFFNLQTLSIVITAVLAIAFLKSGQIKQLIDGFKQLGAVQDNLLTAKDKDIEQLGKQIVHLEEELKAERKENKRLRDFDFDNRTELQAFRNREMLKKNDSKD